MTAPLKPCPFCGAKARMLGGPEAQETYSVWCMSKGRRHHVCGTMDAEQTAVIWNTRADAPELVAMVAALRFADETFRDLGWHGKWEVTSAALAAYEALQ